MPRTTGKRTWTPEVSGVAIRKLRERAGYNKQEVANKLGLHQRAVSAWEDGIEPTQRVLAQLDELYGLDIEDYQTLYVPTDAEVERQQERDQRKARVAQQVASIEGDDVPIRFRDR